MLLGLGLVRFKSRSGISVGDCLVLVDLNLQPTVAEVDGAVYTQKRRECIESAVAPILSENFLSSLDGSVKAYMNSDRDGSTFVGRFVDELLIYSSHNQKAVRCRNLIVTSNPDLVFTC